MGKESDFRRIDVKDFEDYAEALREQGYCVEGSDIVLYDVINQHPVRPHIIAGRIFRQADSDYIVEFFPRFRMSRK